jgi:hypothetical protein
MLVKVEGGGGGGRGGAIPVLQLAKISAEYVTRTGPSLKMCQSWGRQKGQL